MNRSLRRSLALLPVLGLSLPSAQTSWTVDDNGPADFNSIQAAVTSPLVAGGDVLLVEPGNYGAVSLTKEIHILGNPSGPRPSVTDIDAQNVKSFTLYWLDTAEIDAANVPARSRIDRCDVGIRGISIDNCPEVVVTRTTSFPTAVEGFFSDGVPAVDVSGTSRVQLVDCVLRGADGQDDFFEAGFGGAAVRIFDGSDVWVAGSDLTGGTGGTTQVFSGFDGIGGDGLFISGGSSANVRGSSFHLVAGGEGGGDSSDGRAINVQDFGGPASSATYSGVTVSGITEGLLINPPEPYLYVRGEDAPGETRRLFLYGEAGNTAIVATSFGAQFLELPIFVGAPLWLNPSALVEQIPVTLLGQDDPVNVTWTLPNNPAFTGVAYIIQAAELDPPGFFQGTNSSFILGTF